MFAAARRASPALVLIAFAALMSVGASRLGLGRVTAPGSGFFPFWIAVLLATTAIVVAIGAVRRKTTSAAPPPGWFLRVLLMTASTGAYGLALEYVGFSATSFLFLLFFWYAIDRQPLLRSAGLAAGAALCASLLFDRLLGVHFPRGLVGF